RGGSLDFWVAAIIGLSRPQRAVLRAWTRTQWCRLKVRSNVRTSRKPEANARCGIGASCVRISSLALLTRRRRSHSVNDIPAMWIMSSRGYLQSEVNTKERPGQPRVLPGGVALTRKKIQSPGDAEISQRPVKRQAHDEVVEQVIS